VKSQIKRSKRFVSV